MTILTPNSDFGNQGKITTDFFGYRDTAISTVPQPDGKILVAGTASREEGLFPTNTDFALARYRSDGSLDTSFGNQGKVVTDFFGRQDLIGNMVLQPDGKILVAGTTVREGFDPINTDFALTRYHSNGSLDISFGNQGKVVTDFFGFLDFATSIVILPNAKILIAGLTDDQNSINFGLALYNSDGSLDTSFGSQGKVVTDFPDIFGNASYQDIVESIALRADGKILVAGTSQHDLASDSSDFALALYNSDGSLDTSFGNQGKVVTDFFG